MNKANLEAQISASFSQPWKEGGHGDVFMMSPIVPMVSESPNNLSFIKRVSIKHRCERMFGCEIVRRMWAHGSKVYFWCTPHAEMMLYFDLFSGEMPLPVATDISVEL